MNGYFGDASGPMRQYLRYQRQRINADAQFKKLRDEPHKLAYLDLEFFETSQTLFDQAEAAVDPDSAEAKHIAVRTLHARRGAASPVAVAGTKRAAALRSRGGDPALRTRLESS